MVNGRTCRAALTVWAVAAIGCTADPTPDATALPCTVTSRDGAERVVLLSEALALRETGQRAVAEFNLAVSAARPVELQLASVGCNCYQVQRDGETMTVGERFVISAGDATRIRIVSQPSIEPGLRHYHAEFATRSADGSTCAVPLTHEIQTLADITVRPEVLHVDLKPANPLSVTSVPVMIEQHVRTSSPDEIAVAWDALPGGLTATDPVQSEPPQEISAGLWRTRWQSALSACWSNDEPTDSPRQLRVVSRLRDRELARTNCTVIARRRSGVSAPPLVHFGRLSPESSALRRIQLRALDNLPFAIVSVAARDGTVEADVVRNFSQPEHWLEVRASDANGNLDDVLTIETDHPASRSVQIAVKGLGAVTGTR